MPPAAPLDAAWTALPLVVAAQDGALSVDEDARTYLQTLRGPTVHVLGVTGPSHTGKRLLVNTMLHAAAQAPSSGDEDDKRVLLWLWHPPHQSETDGARLVVTADTRDDDASTTKRRMMALLLLLSSAILYNDDGEIDAQALERLAWLRVISSSLRITLNQDDDGVAADFHTHAPKFIWVQRNSKIKWLTDAETGDKLTATQYLEKCLAEESGFSDAVSKRNEQRMYFNSFFKLRECVALSRATEGTADVPVAALPRDALRSQFVDAVDKLFTSYLAPRGSHQIAAKTLLGRVLRADQLVHVIDAYVGAIAINALPAIQTASNALLQKTVEAAFETARAEYDHALAAAATATAEEEADADAAGHETTKPLGTRAVTLAHWRGLQRAMVGLQTLAAQLPEQTKKTVYNDGLKALRSEFTTRLETLKLENATHFKAHCEQLLSDLLPVNLEQIAKELESRSRESFSDGLVALLMQYKSDLRDAVDAYKSQASQAGPALYESLVHALLAAVFESIKAYGASVLRQYQQHMRALQDERTRVEHELQAATAQDTNASFSTEDHKRLYEDQLDQSTQQLADLRRVLMGELNGKKSELDRLMNSMELLDAKHDARVANTESDLAWVRSRMAELEKTAMAEREKLEQDMTGATEEMLSKERTLYQEERSLLAQQKEVMTRVIELERELVQKKTKHVQRVFAMESEIAKRVDELKQEQAEFARQLKSQAKTDTGVLKLAYQKKKNVVQAEIERVAREMKEYEDKLKAYDVVRSPTAKTATTTTIQTEKAAEDKSKTTTATASSATVVSALRTRSREFLFKLDSPKASGAGSSGSAAAGGVTGGGSATGSEATATSRSDADMCKTQ